MGKHGMTEREICGKYLRKYMEREEVQINLEWEFILLCCLTSCGFDVQYEDPETSSGRLLPIYFESNYELESAIGIES
jgi:hypothetical protein